MIEHPFFIDRTSSIWYESVEELENHINGVSVPLCLTLSLSHPGSFPDENSKRSIWKNLRGYATL